jgi:hypothetical protein
MEREKEPKGRRKKDKDGNVFENESDIIWNRPIEVIVK